MEPRIGSALMAGLYQAPLAQTEISKIISKYVGEWKIGNGRLSFKVVARKIEHENFVLLRTYEDEPVDDNFVGLRYIWFDAKRNQFRQIGVQDGKPLIVFAGKWNEKTQTLIWQADILPNEELKVIPGLQKEIQDVFSDRQWISKSTLFKDGKVFRESQGITFEFVKKSKLLDSGDATAGSTLSRYVGNWNYSVRKTDVSGTVRIDSIGDAKPMLLTRYYGPANNLSEVRFIFDDGDDKFVQMYTTNSGQTVNMSGTWNSESNTMGWKTTLAEQEILFQDHFKSEQAVTIQASAEGQSFFNSTWTKVVE